MAVPVIFIVAHPFRLRLPLNSYENNLFLDSWQTVPSAGRHFLALCFSNVRPHGGLPLSLAFLKGKGLFLLLTCARCLWFQGILALPESDVPLDEHFFILPYLPDSKRLNQNSVPGKKRFRQVAHLPEPFLNLVPPP